MKTRYAGKSNDFVASFIFDFFSKGKKNHKVKVEEFVEKLTLPLMESESFKKPHKLVFNMFDKDRDEKISLVDILASFVQLDPSSRLSLELHRLIENYEKNAIRGYKSREVAEFNFQKYLDMVPKSVMIDELKNKFAFFGRNPDPDGLRGESCCFKRENVFRVPKTDEIRKYYDLFAVAKKSTDVEEAMKFLIESTKEDRPPSRK